MDKNSSRKDWTRRINFDISKIMKNNDKKWLALPDMKISFLGIELINKEMEQKSHPYTHTHRNPGL